MPIVGVLKFSYFCGNIYPQMNSKITELRSRQAALRDRITSIRASLIPLKSELAELKRALSPHRPERQRDKMKTAKDMARQIRYEATLRKYGDGGERSFDDLVNQLCSDYQLDRDKLFGAYRGRQYTETRFYLMWLIRIAGGRYGVIGRVFGCRRSQTALYACRTFIRLSGQATLCRELLRRYKVVNFNNKF